MSAGPDTGTRAPRFAAAALLLAVSVALSRVLGLVRDRVLAHQLGVGADVDAYSAAFLVPDVLNYFLAGGALSIAFIPLYTQVRTEAGMRAAAELFSKVLGTMGAVAVAGTVVLWLAADFLVARAFGGPAGFAPETLDLTVRLTRILLPAQVFFVLGGIVRAVLMAEGRFASQALAPLVYNAGIIAGGAAWGATIGAEAFAWGALAGAVVGPFAIPLVEALRNAELRPRPRFAPFDPQVLRYLVLAAPLMFGVSLLTVDEWYEKVFGARLVEGTVGSIGYARRLVQVPIAVVGQAIATAALPTLSALFAEGRRDELHRVMLDTLRAGLGLAIVGAAALLAFAHPLVVAIVETGRFGAEDSTRVAHLLSVFAFGVPAWIVQQIAVRAFYARGQMWFPMLLGTGVAVAFVPLYLVMGSDAVGLATAGVIGMSTNALITLIAARQRHGGPDLGPLVPSALRAALVGAAAAGVGNLAGGFVANAWLTLAVGGTAFGVVTLAGVRAIGDPPMRASLARLIARVVPSSRSAR